MEFEQTSNPLYSQYIHKSRYARWLEDEQRRETWPETVDRYFNFFDEHLKENFPKRLKDYRKMRPELERAVLDLSIMPSMRCLMTAGKALKRDNVAGYNPVSGRTRVVVKDVGNVEIRNLSGGSFSVLNKNGEWVDATFRSYGKQPVKTVNLRLNSNTEKFVEATDNHRWVLQDGTVKPTSELVEGDRIDFVSAPKPEIDEDYTLGVRHGLIYGDGPAIKTCNRVKGYHIRLCDKSSEQLEWFNGYPVCYPESANGDPVVMLYDGFAATHDLKQLPSNSETDSYLLGFVRGWLAADGSVTKNSQVSLCCSERAVGWLQDYAERLGFVVQHVYKQSAETNYGKRRQSSYVVYFSRSSMVADDFLCSWKRANFKELESHYVVKSVEDRGYEEEVFCAEVPDTNTFVLEGGLVTGNCSFVAVDNMRVFDEIMYVLLCGTGVGFSVERQFINKLPEVAEEFHSTETVIVVPDSKIGWATSFRELISLLYAGKIPKWDMSKIRPAGERLKTFGGRASGPEPLEDLFRFSVELFKSAAGRKLNSIECHDLVCKVADIVVVGGVRRSALISLSNLTDDRMRVAKSGKWWEDNPQRALANNSVCYTEKPDIGIFMKEWISLYESKSGERGIFYRGAAQAKAASNGRRDEEFDFGTNPCSEIILRSKQFCNLSEVVVRHSDTLDTIRRKVRLATVLGTLQATLTNFRYLSKAWTNNTKDERLLGVSLTGIMDHPVLSGTEDLRAEAGEIDSDEYLEDWLNELKNEAIKANEGWSGKLGINQSAAITCVKPSGTVSQLVDSGSGIHPRYSEYYIRTVRADKKDPLAQYMINKGFPVEDDVMKPQYNYVFSFPIQAPEKSVFRNDRSALEQLEFWKTYQDYWCEHKPSITVYVKENEWIEVGAWVYKNFDSISGISFLPHTDHSYRQAPYQECSKEEYEEFLKIMPENVDWKDFIEEEDKTVGSQEYACSGGACEIV